MIEDQTLNETSNNNITMDLNLKTWYRNDAKGGTVYARGRGIHRGEILTNEDLTDYFVNIKSIEDAITKAQSLNGYFGIIIQREDDWLCVTDHLRAYPLFVAKNGETVELTETIRRPEQFPQEDITSQTVEAEFLTTGYVTGTDTLIKSAKQLPAGSVIVVDESGIVSQNAWQDCGETSKATTTKKELKTALINAFERLCTVADGRQIIIPLSAGYDSRILALLAAQSDYENIVTVTHGQKNNSEAKVAKSIAANLGLDWIFVEYSPSKWSNWYYSDSFQDFRKFSYDYATLPGHVHMMWPCIQELYRRDAVEADAIFVPGHSIASPAEHVPEEYTTKQNIHKEELIGDILEKNYWLFEYDETITSWFIERISTYLPDRELIDPHNAARLYEEWDYRERQAKWINKDIDCYEWFDVDWWLPFWDRELITSWNGVSLQKRQGKRLMREIADEWYQEVGDVPASKTQASENDSIVRKGFYFIRGSPLNRLLRPLNQKLRYRYDPSGWPGIMPQSLFEAIYTGNENRHTFFALEQTERVNFRTGEWEDCPTDGVLRPHHLRALRTNS